MPKGKQKMRIILLFLISLNIQARDVNIAWDASISPDGVTSYEIGYGTSPGQYTMSHDAGLQTSTTITGLSDSQTYFFGARSKVTDTENYQSSPYSNEVTLDALLPDVIVTSVSYANGIFTSVVKNQGTVATPSGVPIGVRYLVNGTYRTWGVSNTPIAAGASRTVGTNGGAYTIPNGTHTITAFADDINRFAESDETNNKLTINIDIQSTPPVVAPVTGLTLIP